MVTTAQPRMLDIYNRMIILGLYSFQSAVIGVLAIVLHIRIKQHTNLQGTVSIVEE